MNNLLEDIIQISKLINELTEAELKGKEFVKTCRKSNAIDPNTERVVQASIIDLHWKKQEYVTVNRERLSKLLRNLNVSCPIVIEKGCFSSSELSEGYIFISQTTVLSLKTGNIESLILDAE